MLFVFGAIDVILLKNNKAVDIKRGFLPFTFWQSAFLADTVVELPAGMAKGVHLGDVLKLS
jgi:uncharacterized membrane protein (UPF0127 family)